MLKTKFGQTLVLLVAGMLALVFVKLMYDMNVSMARMTGHVGTLARDVSAMRVSMEDMSAQMQQMHLSMQRMDANIQGMTGAVEQGGKMFKQWDPTQMMR